MSLLVERTGSRLARQVEVAATPWRRMKGLLGRASVAPDYALVIRPCSAIHTWFMRCAIDAVFIDRDGIVVKVVPDLGPFRVALGGPSAYAVVELGRGRAAAVGVAVGDRLVTRAEPQDVR